jgi:GNAT superfamily N-acetyltransferase
MLQQAEQLARQLGCCKLTLEVLTQNHPARRSYLAFGFEPYQLQPERGHAEFWHKKLDAADAKS